MPGALLGPENDPAGTFAGHPKFLAYMVEGLRIAAAQTEPQHDSLAFVCRQLVYYMGEHFRSVAGFLARNDQFFGATLRRGILAERTER